MKIGLYGGSFDPIHNAHLIIAQYVKEELNLDRVIFIPSATPPHKSTFVAPALRLQMVRVAIADAPGFECSDVEIKRGGTSYSVDTIAYFRQIYALSKEQLFWIMGSDNLLDFPNWKEPEKILELCTLVVFPRSKDNFAKAPPPLQEKVVFLHDAPIIEISSTTVRNFLHNNRSIEYLVPPPVAQIIRDRELYR